jgi:dienelactone hydrolase
MKRTIPLALIGVLTASGAEEPPATARRAPGYPDHAKLLEVRDGDGRAREIRTRDDWDVRRAHILAHVQEVMGPLPGGERRVPLDPEVVEEHDEPAYVRRKVTFAVEPGDRVAAWLLIPKGRAGPRPAMLCLHQTTPLGKDEPAGLGGKPNLRYARELAGRGYVALAPDYPGFGESRADAYALGYASASMKGIWNHMRAVDLLASLPEVDPGRIGAIGHSLGGHNAIFVAVFDERIKAVVSSCGFNAFPYYSGGNLAGWSHAGYMPRIKSEYGLDPRRVPFDFPELIAALAPRPVFVSAPQGDENFAVEGVRVCIEAARPVYALLGAPGALDAAYPDAAHDFPPAQREAAYARLDRALRPGP